MIFKAFVKKIRIQIEFQNVVLKWVERKKRMFQMLEKEKQLAEDNEKLEKERKIVRRGEQGNVRKLNEEVIILSILILFHYRIISSTE